MQILNVSPVDIFQFAEVAVDVIVKIKKIVLIISVNLTMTFTHIHLINLDILQLLHKTLF